MNVRKKMAGRDIAGILLLAVSAAMLGRSLALCFARDIWYDELFTVGMIEHSYGDLIAFTARDVHPPLYYCIVRFVVELCKLIAKQADPIIIAKLVSVIPYFGLFAYSVTFIRKRFGLFTGGLVFFCVIAMPQLSAYTVEVRMYGWALFFVTAAFLHAYGTGDMSAEIKMGRLHGAALVVYGLAAAYTQYFACVAVVMVYLYVLLVFMRRDRGRIREWLLWVGISIAGYLPWLFALYRQITTVRENYWILPLTWRSLGGCVKFLMKPAFADERLNTVLAVLLFTVYIAIWGYQAVKLYHSGRESERFWFVTAGIGVLTGLVLFGFVSSFLLRPIFVYRYMIPALGCFWLSFALGVDYILCKPKIGIVVTILAVVIGLRDYRAFMGEEEYKAVNMKETQKALSLIGPEDAVLYNFDQVQAVTGYYLPERAERFLWRGEGETLIQEITSPCGSLQDAGEISRLLSGTQEKEGKTIWFIGSFNSRDDIVDEWQSAGLNVEEKGSFLLERYWFNLYKISTSDHTTF